jgi:outer membrane protein OmpA-like peptidoglycan-associated protein
MNFKLAIAVLLAAFIHQLLSGQSETYSVKKASFSTDKYDEFSPVGYKNGIVFCTNRTTTKVLSYTNQENKGFVKMDFIDTLGSYVQGSSLFSKKLTTKFNDGPVTFNSHGDTIYFSRNIIIDGKRSELSSVRNKLGIFYAVFDGTDWSKIRELRINNEWYNVTTPWLSTDGKKLFFASDKPGGYGGSDLYYCQWRNDYWEDPVNLGSVINTKGNESYPFINAAGEFFFSSDGHPGVGGKDIFFSRYADSTWSTPVCLDAPINSQYDDFGIFTDTLMQKGYFSSNRDKSIDIFQFKTNFPQIFYSAQQKENNYCFIFNDSGSVVIDTLNLRYKWSFGDGKSTTGMVVSHCFPGPGNYNIRLDIIERANGRVFFTKLLNDVEIRDYEQAYINAPDYSVKGDQVSFDALKSYVPGYKIINCSWDFGDSQRAKGEKVTHVYATKGEYAVNLEVALRSDSTGLVKKTGITRKIIIFEDAQAGTAYLAKGISVKKQVPDVRISPNASILTRYSAESEFKRDAVFRIELISSKTKLDINGSQFKNVPQIFTIKERFDPNEGLYSYTIDQQLSLMATYPSYMKIASLGFKEVKVKMEVLTDPAEKELHNLIRINGAFADTYFDNSDRLTSNAFIMLDQIVKLMNKYPVLKLEVAVHTDNSGLAENNLAVSQKRAQLLVDYLTTRGISIRRLVATGFGGSKPIAPNFLEKDRKLNRRIDFIIISK